MDHPSAPRGRSLFAPDRARAPPDLVVRPCSAPCSNLVEQFLAERALTLSQEKARIVRIDDGFDFLGFNVRKYNGKRLIKPPPSNIAAVKENARAILRRGASLPQDGLIGRLYPVLQGWGSYYRHVVSNTTGSDPAFSLTLSFRF
ncbi:MAG: group II intron maturase-specific domain-containing protein [Chromatiaceae bacterium]